ncbi:hypothetical protein [Streptomyces catenulae]|uniref:Uncharacterized protein n=1 Tax=Streptomyces catenulae TaxID=66875 RepID=A0ABV2Z6N7_9ACTN|nr:hypothetical protein [Streptomyces catenulae]
MTFRSKTVPILLVLLGGSVPVLLGLQLGWPGWVTVFPALALVALLSLLVVYQSTDAERRADPYGPDPSPVAEPVSPSFVTGPGASPFATGPTAPVEPPFNERRLERVRLASARPDYTFVFSATVWWRPLHGDAGPAQPGLADLAESTVLSLAQAVVGQEAPERWETAHHRLQGEIGCRRTDSSDRITVLADGISLTLDEDDRVRLEKLAQLRKEEDDWERHRDFERNRRAYLGDEVLKTPGSAVVWWLTRHDERVKDAVNMIGPLAQLSAAANDTEIPEPFRHVVAGYPDRESYRAAMYVPDDAETVDDTEYTFRTPMPEADQSPFDPGRGSAVPGGADEGARFTAGTSGEPHPYEAPAAAPDLDVVDRISQLLDELGLKEGDTKRDTYVYRIAGITEAAGLPEQAEQIRERLNARHCPPSEAQPPFTAPSAQRTDHPTAPTDEDRTPDGRPGDPAAGAPADGTPHGFGFPDRGAAEGPGHVSEEAPAPPFDDRPGDGYTGQETHEGRFADAHPADTGGGYGADNGPTAEDRAATPHAAPENTPDGGQGPAPQPSPFDAPDRPGDPRPADHDPRRGYGMPPEQSPDGGYAPPPNGTVVTGHTPEADAAPPMNGTPPSGNPLWWGDRSEPADGGPAAPPAEPPAAPRRVWAMPPADADSQDTPEAADRPEPPHEGGPRDPHTPGFG